MSWFVIDRPSLLLPRLGVDTDSSPLILFGQLFAEYWWFERSKSSPTFLIHNLPPSLDLGQGWGAGLYDTAVPSVASCGMFLGRSILPKLCFPVSSSCSRGSGTLLGRGEFRNEYAVGWQVINHPQQKQRVNQAVPEAIWRQSVRHQPAGYSPGVNRAVYLLPHYYLQ